MQRLSRLVVAAGAFALLLVPVAANGANGHASYRAVCPGPPADSAHCHALVVTDSHGNPASGSSPSGLAPATIQSVYGFPTGASAGAGKTIAIVDAFDDPTAESDLGVFSSQFALPACTTANGCFTKVNQSGGSSYPRSDSGWGLEISLDIQWAHAIAPGAKILLVEASSNSFSNLMAAEDYAGGHAQYVSNSWGGSEFSGETSYDSHFSHTGVSFFVSSGDNGLPAEWPSASRNVISVGGTTLHFSGGAFASETGWSSGGGGCSSYESATGVQSSFSQYGQAGCGGKRATPDVSLDADPSSGVSVYDSSYGGSSGWLTVGGTSASSPMWAAASADSGALVDSAAVYGGSIAYRDITSGNNGAPCLTGYDLCSGRGSWLFGGGGGGPTVPGAPTGLTAAGGDASVSLGWSAPGSDGGSSLLGYDVYRSTQANMSNETRIANQVPGTTYTDTGVANGTTYYYEVTAVNSVGESGRSNQAQATPKGSTQSSMTVGVTAGPASKRGPNYKVPVTVTAADSTSGAFLSGASVSLSIHSASCSGPVVATGTGTTSGSGTVGFTFSTRAIGPWCAAATVTAAGYTAGSGTATFSTP